MRERGSLASWLGMVTAGLLVEFHGFSHCRYFLCQPEKETTSFLRSSFFFLGSCPITFANPLRSNNVTAPVSIIAKSVKEMDF